MQTTHTHYLIAGAGHAGLAALEAIRQTDETGPVTVLSAEGVPPYSPTILPHVVSGTRDPGRIALKDGDYFERLGASFRPGCRLAAVAPDDRRVTLASGEEIIYEKLLLATGADAAVPPFAGIGQVDYRVVRTLADALALREAIGRSRTAIVIGAGLIAMHTAENMARAGLSVTLVVRRRVSLFAYFDGEAARMIEAVFAANGVTIQAGSGVSEVAPEDGGCAVKLASGKVLKADLLLLATGVRPRVDYLKGSGIEVDQGIVVDGTLRTSAEGVWAAGDVAQAPGFFDPGKTVNATLPNASVQGRIAGRDMAGDAAVKPYPGSSGLNTFNFFGHHAFSLGLATVAASDGDFEVNTVYLPSSRQYQKLVFRGDRVVGVSAINTTLDPGVLRELIQRRIDLGPVKERFATDPLTTGRLLMTRLWR